MDAAKLEYENSRRKEFRELLAELASSQDYLKDKSARIATYKRLEALYYSPNEDECYRHLYSDIFVVLTQVVTKDLEGDINILGQNILCIYKGYHPKNYNSKGQLIDISENVRKLYDHTSLDIARLNYSEGRYRNLVGEEDIADLRARSGLIEDQLAHAEKKLIVAEDKVSSLQKEYITILGIFASIVITFVAGMTFSTSVLANIDKASIYRLVFIVALIGLGLFNLVNLLLRFIQQINKGNAVKNDEIAGYLKWINIVIFSIIILDIFIWAKPWLWITFF